MKKTIAVIVTMIFFFGLPILTYAGQGNKRYKKNERGRYERVYPKNHPYNHPRGRAYGHYKDHRNMHRRNYKYKRHYTWHQWKRHHHEYNRYYNRIYHHDDRGFLMFSFCEDRDQRVCFSISID
jgi:hypothetical protein